MLVDLDAVYEKNEGQGHGSKLTVTRGKRFHHRGRFDLERGLSLALRAFISRTKGGVLRSTGRELTFVSSVVVVGRRRCVVVFIVVIVVDRRRVLPLGAVSTDDSLAHRHRLMEPRVVHLHAAVMSAYHSQRLSTCSSTVATHYPCSRAVFTGAGPHYP